MRARTGAAGLGALIVMLGASAPAQAEVWCRRDLSGAHTMCGFATAQQCLAAVRVSGGACDRGGVARHAAEPRRAVRSGTRYAHYSSTPLPVNLNPSRFDCSN